MYDVIIKLVYHEVQVTACNLVTCYDVLLVQYNNPLQDHEYSEVSCPHIQGEQVYSIIQSQLDILVQGYLSYISNTDVYVAK